MRMGAIEAIKSIVFRSEHATASLRKLRVVLHYVRGRPHEADFNFLSDPLYADGLLLDLGANIGQSAISVAAVQSGLTVLSIEANPACEAGLKTARWLLGRNRFSYRLVGVGPLAGRLDFHVPIRASRMLLEEGTFDADTLESPGCVQRLGRRGREYEIKVLSIPLVTVDSLGISPRIVKMDLQGLELGALQGMHDTIARCHPTFMIEIGEHHDEVMKLLQNHGYTRHHWDGQRLQPGVRPDTLNAIFIAKQPGA